MSHRTKLAGAWTLLLALLVTSCSDSPAGPGQGPDYTPVRIPQPNTDPLILHDNVVVIDSAVLHMASSSSEITAGTYRFDILGSPVPLIEVGEVVVGPEGLGFMGIATSISYGAQVVVRTTQAYLVDVIKEGSLDVSEPLDFSASAPAPGSALAPFYYLAPGVRPEVRLFQIENVDLCDLAKKASLSGCPEGISLTLPSGYVDLTADGRFKLRKRWGLIPLDTLMLSISGNLVFDVTAKAVAKQAFSMGDEVVLRSLAVPLPLPGGANKVLKTTLLVSLKAGFNATAEVEARVQSGVHMEAGVEIGGEWTFDKYDLTRGTPDHTGWRPIWDPTFSAEQKETSWAAQGSGFVRVYVRPDVQFIMLGLEGPRAGLEPNLKVTGTAGTESCQMRLTRSTDANVELFVHFLRVDWSTDTLTVPFPGAETDLIEPIPCPIGHLNVVTTTSGLSLDPDGYTVTLDQSDPKPIMNMGSVMYSPLPPATYTVELTGLADNCTVSLNPRSIMVPAGDTTLVSFPVVCTDPAGSTGGLQVNAMTTGEEDGYTVVIDNDVGAGQALEVDGMVTFAALTSGNHSVELTDFGPSCVVAGDNPRTVTIVQDATVSTDFDVSCGLTVNVTTIGSDFDPDGYSVIVDAGSLITPVDINGSAWLDIAPGLHDIELIDLASGCRVSDDNPRSIDSPGEETFDVICGPGITFVRDLNVWQILPDGNGLQQLTTDAGGYGHVKWSPDGTRMVFTRPTANCAPDCGAIFTADADGSNATPLTVTSSFEHHAGPDWSPDGTKIVFGMNRTPFTQSVVTMNSDGSSQDTVRAGVDGTNNYAFPSWTPAGQIVYVERVIGQDSDDGYVAIMNADGSLSVRITTTESARVYEPDYSPEGNRIAFRRKLYDTETSFDLMVVNADGSNGSNPANLSNQLFDVWSLEWSPDGSQIAYTVEAAGGLWLIDVDGGNNGSNTIMLTSGGGTVAWRTLP